jgi:cytochrome o ubiquinol oxidase subunit 2
MKKNKLALFIFIIVDVALLGIALFLIFGPVGLGNIAIFNPKGIIAAKEKSLIVTATILMLSVIIPVFIIMFYIVWKYKAGKAGARYSPEMKSNLPVGSALWLIPIITIAALSVLNWKSTHALDPYKLIASDKKPITIQVVALQWKWLFIYPAQNIAAVNFLEFPANTPINFELTSDAPMNSFWIPQLGGQMYAMAGMQTQLHLMANEAGEYVGSSAEISGKGFAGMKFVAKAVTEEDFNGWAHSIRQGANLLNAEDELTMTEYEKLAMPSENNSVVYYQGVEKNLFNSIMAKFMAPAQK